METDGEIDRLRERLLFATLPHVPFDGWTGIALQAGARDLGISLGLALNAFPGGAAETIEYWNRLADRRMLAALEAMDLGAMKVRQRVAAAVRLRIEQSAAHREAVRRGVAFLALPPNAGIAARCLYRTVDAIWHGVGDKSTDFSFYTKRGLLAGVYSATVFYWLNDRSPDFADTWGFLERRIDDVMRIPRLTAPLRRVARYIPDPFRLFRGFDTRR